MLQKGLRLHACYLPCDGTILKITAVQYTLSLALGVSRGASRDYELLHHFG